MMTGLKKHVTKKRLLVSSVAIAVVGTMSYTQLNQTPTEIRYLTATAEKGLFIASISGTGQVVGENQIDVKPAVSAPIVAINMKDGQRVTRGDILATLDTKEGRRTVRDAQQTVRDAKISLDSAKLSLAKLSQPATTLERLQAQNALQEAKRALQKLQEGASAYDIQHAKMQIETAEQNTKISADGVTPQVIRNAYDTLEVTAKTTMQALESSLADADTVLAIDNPNANISFANLLSILDHSQKLRAVAEYGSTKIAIQSAKQLVDALASQHEDPIRIDAAVAAEQTALQQMDALLTSVSRALLATIPSASFSQSSLDQLKSTINSDRSTVNSKLSTLLSQIQSTTQAKNTYASAGLTLKQAQLSLEELLQPADSKDLMAAAETIAEREQALKDLDANATTIDLQIAQNSVDQRASSLTSAQHKHSDALEALQDYTVRAPFDGVIAKVSAQIADTAGPSTAIATMITAQKIAQITLNEIDAASVHVGQKATLTFDAIENVSLTGGVLEISTLGTVSQGVVSYTAKVGFDTQDERIKPGMSVQAAIITKTNQDVVLVPNAAVKTSGDLHYVQRLAVSPAQTTSTASNGSVTGTPEQVIVEIGGSNETVTEITQGLSGGETVITQTISVTTAKTSTTQTRTGSNTSLIPGLPGSGGATRAFTTR